MGSQKGAESLLGATRIVLTIGEYRRARARSPLVGGWTFHPAGCAYFRPMTDWQAESYAALGQGRTPVPPRSTSSPPDTAGFVPSAPDYPTHSRKETCHPPEIRNSRAAAELGAPTADPAA